MPIASQNFLDTNHALDVSFCLFLSLEQPFDKKKAVYHVRLISLRVVLECKSAGVFTSARLVNSKYRDDGIMLMIFVDMQARKEAIMNQVRSEVALSNAQELINVRLASLSLVSQLTTKS